AAARWRSPASSPTPAKTSISPVAPWILGITAARPMQALCCRPAQIAPNRGESTHRAAYPPGPHLSCLLAEDGRAGIMGAVAQFLLNADELVVFGEPVRTREAACLDLPAIGGDGEIGDGRILRLARAVRHHAGVARP